MTCTHPIVVKVSGLGMTVPCGRCMACRVSRTREWAVRLVNELEAHPTASFVTLTYAPEHLPKDNGLQKRDLQLFWKRLRKEVTYDRLRYFACGEYGDTYGRPHYHAILYGLPAGRDTVRLLRDTWSLGLVHAGSVTYQSARYVAQYCQKKLNGEEAKKMYGDKQAPFALMSKGLGLDYCMAHAQEINEKLTVFMDGKKVGLPRYYRKKLAIDQTRLAEQAIKRESEESDFVAKRAIEYKSDVGNLVNAIYELDNEVLSSSKKLTRPEYVLLQRDQRDKNLRARFSLTKSRF